MNEENLSRQFEQYVIRVRQEGNDNATYNDFFDHIRIPYDQRSDFFVAAILDKVDWDLIDSATTQESFDL